MFPLYGWYNFNRQLIRRTFGVLRTKQTSLELRGINSVILRTTKTVSGDYYRGWCAKFTVR